MRNPYFRLFFISVNVLLWSALVIGFLRYLGNQQSYTQFDHVILNQDQILLYKTNSLDSILQIPEIVENKWNIIPMINVEIRERDWHVVEILSKNPYKTKSHLLLDEFLNTYQLSKLAINVANKHLRNLKRLSEILAQKENVEVLFTSETTGILHEVRKEKPKWLFMSSHALVAKLQIMGALYLENLVQINEDLVFLNSSNELDERLLTEVNKRYKKIILKVNKKPNADQQSLFKNFLSADLALLKEMSVLKK